MAKKYHVDLTESEQQELGKIISGKKATNVVARRAYILLASDRNGSKAWSDAQISSTYRMRVCNIEKLRKRFVEDGFEQVLYGKPQEKYKDPKFDGQVEAKLIALRCSNAPEGYNKWSLRLLADKMVELSYAESISHEGVRRILKKTNLSLGKYEVG